MVAGSNPARGANVLGLYKPSSRNQNLSIQTVGRLAHNEEVRVRSHPFMKSLEGKKALVTAIDSDIGRTTSKELAIQGADIVCTYLLRDRDREIGLDAALEQIRETGRKVEALELDQSDPKQVEDTVRRAAEILGGLDIMVAVAAASVHKPFLEQTAEDDRIQVLVNVAGTLGLIRESCRAMTASRTEQEDDKSIVLIGSICGEGGILPGGYAASKAAIAIMPTDLSGELGRQGIRINTVIPGATDTASTRDELKDADGSSIYVQEWGKLHSLRRPDAPIATPEDIAKAVRYFADGTLSPFVTGEALNVSGGYRGTWRTPGGDDYAATAGVRQHLKE